MRARYCRKCGRPVPATGSFCSQCGAPISEVRAVIGSGSPSVPTSSHEATTFDVAELGRNLDSGARASRVALIFLPAMCAVMFSLLLLAFLPRILHGSLYPIGWFGLLVFAGLTAWAFATGVKYHFLWASRRAAESLLVNDDRVVVNYPEGPAVFQWSEPRPFFEVIDMTPGLSWFTWTPSTPYWLKDRGRMSALSAPAYERLLATARNRDAVRSLEPGTISLLPGVDLPDVPSVRWAISGKASTTTLRPPAALA